MHIPDVHEYSDDAADAEAKRVIPTLNRDAIVNELQALLSVEYDRLEEEAGYFITQTAATRAERFLEKVLSGDEDAAKALFSESDASRYRRDGVDSGSPWASVIHGRVFETSVVALRPLVLLDCFDLLLIPSSFRPPINHFRRHRLHK